MRPSQPHSTARPRLLATAGVLLIGVAPALAQEVTCTLEGLGRVACIAGRLCACEYAPGSYATRLPDGFRWDCGILRPHCGAVAPATLDPWPQQLPDALAIDRSRTIIKKMPPRYGGWPHH
jgi:hypothetical protein